MNERVELLCKARDCAREAGIADHMFLSFGTLLGAVRPTMRKDRQYHLGIMEHDHDMDIGWLPCDPEKSLDYYRICKDKGIMNWPNPGKRTAWDSNGKLLWFSIRTRPKGPKSCNWFFFRWNNFMWHSKGQKWVNAHKFPRHFNKSISGCQAIMLGAPAKYFVNMKEIDFEGERFQIPESAGSLCDFWYPGWHEPKKSGSSSKQVTAVVPDWNVLRSWRMI